MYEDWVSLHLGLPRAGTSCPPWCPGPGQAPHRGCQQWRLLDPQGSLLPQAFHCLPLYCCFLGAQLGVSSCLGKCQESSPDARRQPFSGKSFYLDLPAGKNLQFLTGAIQQLGGVGNLLLPRAFVDYRAGAGEGFCLWLPGIFRGITAFSKAA